MKEYAFDDQDLRTSFSEVGQDHIFRFWKDLNQEEKKRFLKQLQQVDLKECTTAWHDIHKPQKKITNCEAPSAISSLSHHLEDLKLFREKGEEILKNNKVAAFTVAGGQGTRLGHDGPKGTLKCTPLRQISLFEQFAENLKFYEKRFGHSIWWFIMTSADNHLQTQSFFQENKFFGLDKNHIHFLQQGMMPVFDLEGKILLQEKNQLLMSPNGHGGSFKALLDSGALQIMDNEGIDYLSYFQVDNPLVYCLDPMFIGSHIQGKSEMSSKAVDKVNSKEKVGTFVKLNNTLQVLEYSDIPDDLVEKTTSEGRLTYHLGNIAIHLLNRDFVKSVASASQEQANRLIYHGALKKVKCLDETGNTLLPDAPNGLKAETFVFDAIPLAQNASIFEIDRLEEFAPIKNSTGTDSPESSRKIQLSRARRWLLSAGIKPLPKEAEISPSYAPTQQHFLEKTSKLSIDPAAMQDQKIMIDESGITAAQKYNEQLIND